MATKIYSTSYPENPPEWYWTKGLHDAGIIEVESFEFPFDYNKFVGQKSKYNRNLLKLKIDSKGAIYDTSVKEIHFYNYRLRLQAWHSAPEDNGQVQLPSSPRGYCTLCQIIVHLNRPHTVLHLNWPHVTSCVSD